MRHALIAFFAALVISCQHGHADPSFSSIRIPEERLKEQKGDYILSNEHEAWRFNSHTSNLRGALISVGTFRTLDMAAQGEFDHIVMIDYDALTTLFNRFHLDMIRKAPDRFDYFEKLTGLRLAPEQREWLGANDPESFAKFRAWIEKSANGFEWRGPGWREEFSQNRDEIGSWLKKMTASKENWDHNFFSSNEKFTKIQNLIKSERALIINGNIAGPATLKALGDKLRERRIKVSAVNVSNILDYFHNKGGPFADNNLHRQFPKFFANLHALPLDENAKIFFTSEFNGVNRSNAPSGWNYLVVAASNFLADETDISHQYAKYIESLLSNGEGCSARYRK